MIGGMAFSTSTFGDYRAAISRTFVPLAADPLDDRPFRAGLRPVFCDSTRPFGFTFAEPFEQVVVQVPRRAVAERTLRRATAVPLAGDGPGGAVGAFFRALAPHVPGPLALSGIGLLGEALTLAAGTTPAPGELDRQRVLDFLRQSFRDPALDAGAVAAACHLSRRALFRLFAGAPLSLAGEVRRLRVAEASRLLRRHPGRSVADLAPACGFAGETQLRRAFRAVTGTTPGAFRTTF
jgi:AraC-like DNA-binding protein